MSLATGGPVNFRPRPVEGAPKTAEEKLPQFLLLDGQQRMTSLYQVTLRGKVVETRTVRDKRVKRWFYIDIRKALDSSVDRQDAILSVPEDRMVRADFGRQVVLDLSSATQEYNEMMFPVAQVFRWYDWQDGFNEYWEGNKAIRDEFKVFRNNVLTVFDSYQVPVIELEKSTSREAVCVVFEKVNTGGKALDAFELVTATYAASGHQLRRDWYGIDGTPGRQWRLSETLRPAGAKAGILAGVSNTDFLQAVSLFYTRDCRAAAEKAGKTGKELPAVTGNRQALLALPLEEGYLKYQDKVEQGFVRAAEFLHMLYIYRIFDLPYQSQVIALAAILADLDVDWKCEAVRTKLERWYWNGVFGELYGSAVESRIARDFLEVLAWLKGGSEPSTISETTFRAERLKTMRTRLSAAYKGINALLMKDRAMDFRSGQKFGYAIFFEEGVDIHHIFPQKWCKDHGYGPLVFDSILNKTPLSYRTNRIIGGVAPSQYLAKLEAGDSSTNPIERKKLDEYLRSHLIDPDLLRADQFEAFMKDRQARLVRLIEEATGKPAYTGGIGDESDDGEASENESEAEYTMPLQ